MQWMVRVKEQVLVSLCGFLYTPVWRLLSLSMCTAQSKKAKLLFLTLGGQELPMWDDRLPCWCRPFLEVIARQDWKDSLHPPVDMKYLPWHLVERGGFHKKFCWHLQVSTSITQQTSAKSFSLDSLPVSPVLSALLAPSLSFSLLGLSVKRYSHTCTYHSFVFISIQSSMTLFSSILTTTTLNFSSLSSLFWLTLGGHGSPATINNTDK